ncbi:MAG: Hpt domain-containing protein [Bacteroidales bacterium]|jgi:HPt (histidine-containing phosphotransfer) domain-containing protein|nr:Hpt domain-containing protein [Bacteroidales bacterium]
MSDKMYDLSRIEEISPGNDKFVRELIDTFVKTVVSEVTNIERLKSTGNWKTIAEIAHKLVSNYAYLGAEDLKQTASDIEKSVSYDNLDGISEKIDKLCSASTELIRRLKKEFP